MPFYPSPQKDDGYDIADFYNVHPALGSLGDFVEFMRTVRRRMQELGVYASMIDQCVMLLDFWIENLGSDRASFDSLSQIVASMRVSASR